ncbi:MAG: DUF3050 domain-containing protein [Bacteroidota bacterium]|nr:DUF3050 domain-containing protein [Bacteroidota bacterium]
MTKERIDTLNRTLAPIREQIVNHPLYHQIKSLDDVCIFMQSHVCAVWDFMSLLKSLQNHLTCTSVPWFPVGSAQTRFLINEIVVGEESDIDIDGIRKSHFEMYIDAMNQSGADTSVMLHFLQKLAQLGDVQKAIEQSYLPQESREFIQFTFEVILKGAVHQQAAIFTFGREDLIPSMFMAMVEVLHHKIPEKITKFKYYLDRHIEIDGDHHSNLAIQMVENLCGEDEQKWREVEEISAASLQMRIKLWDGVYQKLVFANI